MKPELIKLLVHFPEEEQLVKKYYDLCLQAVNGKIILTDFLNPREQEVISMLVNHFNLFLHLDGGYETSEIKRGLISNELLFKKNMNISILEIIGNQKFRKLTHRDVLGALMSLQVKRELFGDFIFGEKILIIIDSKIESLIINNINKIANVTVRFEKTDQVVTNIQEFTNKKMIVKSLRVDALISQVFKVSRNDAKKLVESGSVKIDYKLVKNPSSLVNKDCDISLKKYGKAKIRIIAIKQGKNKDNKQKDKFVIEINYYK